MFTYEMAKRVAMFRLKDKIKSGCYIEMVEESENQPNGAGIMAIVYSSKEACDNCEGELMHIFIGVDEVNKEDFSIEEMFIACGFTKKGKVFDEEGLFLKGIYEGDNPQIVANTFFNGDIDKLDSLCEEERCF